MSTNIDPHSDPDPRAVAEEVIALLGGHDSGLVFVELPEGEGESPT